MRLILICLLFMLVEAGGFAVAQQEPKPNPGTEKPEPVQTEEIKKLDAQGIAKAEALVKQLGDDNYHVRETASAKILEMGAPVIPVLKKHENHGDFEIRCRIEILLIQLPTRGYYRIVRLKLDPVLDGKTKNDPAWKDVLVAKGQFNDLTTKTGGIKKTFFRMGYTTKGIYIAVKCMEPQAAKIKTKAKEGEHSIFGDDSIEVFLTPPNVNFYAQFVANAAGLRWNGVIPKRNIEMLSWKVATTIGKNWWGVEFLIPFHLFNAVPQHFGDKWKFNICRNVKTGKHELLSWAPVKKSFHEPANFAQLIFMGKLTAKEKREALKPTK